jgi:HSP20 family protein
MTTLMEPLAPWLRDLNRFFTPEAGVPAFMPPADLVIAEDGVRVEMDVPGLTADQIEIELENEVLAVRGERPFPYPDDGSNTVRRIERGFGRFERSLRVPQGLDPDSVQASLHDGVLTLWIPRPDSVKPRRVQIRPETAEENGGPGEQPGSADQSSTGERPS